jgi:hypothetical protein
MHGRKKRLRRVHVRGCAPGATRAAFKNWAGPVHMGARLAVQHREGAGHKPRSAGGVPRRNSGAPAA